MAADARLNGNNSLTHFGDSEGGDSVTRRLPRREFLRAGTLSAASLLTVSINSFVAEALELKGRFLDRIAFEDERIAPVQTPIGAELDGRLYTDLSRISPSRLVTPIPSFFVRTRASCLLPPSGKWQVRLEGGLTAGLSIQSLRAASRPMGMHLIECAGNVQLTRFGLMSVAEWTGMPIGEVLERAKFPSKPSWIEISGFDQYGGPSATSIPGASWVFHTDKLEDAGAFLATGMNGQFLEPDHGAPVRLVVPGWYGCSCIKWVNQIRSVDEDVEATSQMREYAVRTLQPGIPQLARDYDPATIDHAALPIRIEKSILAGRIQYRVVGITWGGSEPIRKLQIRFNPEEEFVPVETFNQVKTDPWTLWAHTWAPQAPGLYTIRLAIADPPVRARKLGLGLYDRSVDIREI